MRAFLALTVLTSVAAMVPRQLATGEFSTPPLIPFLASPSPPPPFLLLIETIIHNIDYKTIGGDVPTANVVVAVSCNTAADCSTNFCSELKTCEQCLIDADCGVGKCDAKGSCVALVINQQTTTVAQPTAENIVDPTGSAPDAADNSAAIIGGSVGGVAAVGLLAGVGYFLATRSVASTATSSLTTPFSPRLA